MIYFGGKQTMAKRKYWATLIMILSVLNLTHPTAANERIVIGDVSADAGEKQWGFIRIPAGEDGPQVKIPVTVINGKLEGPILALIAGVHGYEYPPILAMQRLHEKLKPEELKGAIILVHVANMPGFLGRAIYYTPQDGINLNRAFPGKVDGTMSERIAFQLTKEVIDRCDALVDNHCGDGNEDLMPYMYCTKTGDPRLDTKTRALAESYGINLIIEDERPRDVSRSVYCANTALLRGKPAITIESGKLGRSDEEDIIRVVRGSINVMKHLGILEGKTVRVGDPVWVKGYTILRAEHEGIFYPLLHRGHHVQKGELIGYLTDFFGNRIQEARAPSDGILLYVIATPPMNPGEPMASVGRFHD